mgnify:CR=1 FL=1
MIYKVQLKNFEGPLDLLLYFIRRDELDIYDIPISKITKDFIAVIEEWKRANLVLAGDFIVMASTLMRVKAKMMLPRPELDEDGEIIDPREELMQQLIDYKRFRDASDILKRMSIERSYKVARQFEQEISINEGDDLEIFFKDVTLYDLARKYLPLGAGSVFTFGLKGGYEAAINMVQKVSLFSHLANVGDTRSLILHPTSTTHRQLSYEQREASGAGDNMVRLSIGLETVEDLIFDLDQALS